MKLNDKKIKELYKAHADSSAPDMDALWERIERGLDEKNAGDESGVTSKPLNRPVGLRKVFLRAALAAAAVLIILPIAFGSVSKNDMAESAFDAGASSNGAAVQDMQDMQAGEVTAAATANGMDGGADEAESVSHGTVLYGELDLAPAAFEGNAPSGETSGDDFFVEANVLIHTDVIVNAYVDKAYSRGETIRYELTAENADTGETESITLNSATPFVMLENRSYLLPLTVSGGVYSLAFENAPQIEITLDSGMIFHNGWITLDDGSAADVIYPQNGIDDFFYDRMKFSYGADADTLVKKWHELKGEAEQ
ncbi:MAG: hypothetical protein NC395_02460 [Prevotella sp.]|nr:hypothetical protein [Prevotella sp.]